MKKEDDSNLDAHFPIRTYGKGELAMCYIRGVCQHTAVKQFNEWIRTAPGLEERLLATGMKCKKTGNLKVPRFFALQNRLYRPLFSHNVL